MNTVELNIRTCRLLKYICKKYNKTPEKMIGVLIRRRYEDIMTGVEIVE